MNIKEAYAKATPGPLVVDYSRLPLGIKPTGNDDSIDRVAPLGHVFRSHVRGNKDQQKMNAALLAHAYNVLPEVLEAATCMFNDIVKDCNGNVPRDMEYIRAIIAKASEVKV